MATSLNMMGVDKRSPDPLIPSVCKSQIPNRRLVQRSLRSLQSGMNWPMFQSYLHNFKVKHQIYQLWGKCMLKTYSGIKLGIFAFLSN